MRDFTFRVNIARAELELRLLNRATHHEARAKYFAEKSAKAYDGKADAMRAHFSLEAVAEEELDPSAMYSNKIRQPENDAQKAETHRNVARQFRFIATHLPTQPVFYLDMQQVTSFELIEAEVA